MDSSQSGTPQELRFESIVRPEHRGMTLEVMLNLRFTYHSISEWQDRIQNQCVLVNDQVLPCGSLVNSGERITYIAKDYSEPQVPTHFERIYEDDDFIVVGKPENIPVHHTGKIFWNTFTSVLRRGLNEPEMVPMHRLDRDTSGIMLFARTADTAKRYQKNLERLMLRKMYLAVVSIAEESQLKFWQSYSTEPLRVDIPLREQAGQDIRIQMIPDLELGKPCSTLFRFLNSRQFTPVGGVSRQVAVIEAELLTGRKHQIRAHLAHLGTPIVGDPIYSHDGQFYLKRVHTPLDSQDIAILGSRTQMLHAWKGLFHLPSWREARWLESRLINAEMLQFLSF